MKTYRITHNVGRAKYVVSFHNGIDTHRDGSPFYNVRTFRNKVALNRFVTDLESQGYRPQAFCATT